MKDQHTKITGYRDLSQPEIDMMNKFKEIEAVWNGMLDHIRAMPDIDQRQVSIAATVGEEAFMRAVRSIARPERRVAPYCPADAA